MSGLDLDLQAGIVRLEDALDADAVVERLGGAGFHAVRVDRAPVFDRDTLMHALYQALQLPAWFGFNLDALADALADLEPQQGRRWVLVFQDFSLLEDSDPELAESFCEIVDEACALPEAGLVAAVLLAGRS
jgi:RNAse (barnase) inhibitor barstar